VNWQVRLTETAASHVAAISDARERAQIVKRIGQLRDNPMQQGKPLTGDLAGHYSVRAGGQRYRIVYRVEQHIVTVTVVAAGMRKDGDRKDVYALAQKIVRLALREPKPPEPQSPEPPPEVEKRDAE